MNQTRAFSDTEIVTIAAVAAAALGGIVVGLGRGQEDDRTVPDGSRLESSLRRAQESGRSLVPRVAEARHVIADQDIASELKHALEAVRSSGETVARRASAEIQPSERLSKVAERVHRPELSRGATVVDTLKSIGQDALKSGLARLESVDWDELRQSGADLARQARPEHVDRSGHTPDGIRGLLSRVQDEVESVQDKASSAPEAARDAGRGTGQAVQRHVSEPVSRAASTAGDATKETLAALAWLGLASGIVYFGLLSDERREQVKSAMCSAIEQGRLLMLDLQGYEPEM